MANVKRILLVDEQPMLIKLLQLELSVAGHDLTIVSHGVEALELLEKQPFDIMITEIYLPEMGGIELINAMMQQQITLPIIVLSASRYSQIGSVLERLGVDHFIDKPLSNDKLTLLNYLIDEL